VEICGFNGSPPFPIKIYTPNKKYLTNRLEKKIMKKMNNKGFTLMELLIVVAIIAVLIAIAIPVLNNQLEKSREAVDAANIRSAYAEVSVAFLTGEGDLTKTVNLKQRTNEWQNADFKAADAFPVAQTNEPKKDGTCTVEANEETGEVTITFSTD
jgi:prepilin-type N-terminal cleavage/methylation domain-containing protein